MFQKIGKRTVLLLGVSLLLGLAAAGFLLFPDRLPVGPVQIQVSMGAAAASDAETVAAEEPTKGPAEVPEAVVPPQVEHDKSQETPHFRGILYDAGTKVVNLADPGGYRYLKAGIVLEILPLDPVFYTLSGPELEQAKETILEEIDQERPIIEDIITLTLSSKTFEEVFTIAGKEQLKQELRDQFNARLTIGQVRDIYFTEFVIQ